MKLKDLDLERLYELRDSLSNSNQNLEFIDDLIFSKEIDSLYEDTSGTGGPSGAVLGGSVGSSGVAYANASIGGMGSVVSPQPSMFAGVTNEPGYTDGGGKVGSGDVSVPYNPGGRKKMFQKLSIKTDNRKGTNKRRKNKLLQGLKNVFSNKQDYTAGKSTGKIMNFDKFSKDDLNKVTRVKQ